MRTLPPRVLALLATLASGAAATALTGCIETRAEGVKVAEAPDEDAAWANALADATKSQVIFKDFETRYEVTATYLSPSFRGAFADRLTRVYKQGQGQFDEAGSKAGFFVSVHAPDSERTDLSNQAHWTILMNGKDGSLKPELIKKLDDKERWRAFFPTVTSWTTEYLIVFDTPATATSGLVDKVPVSLLIANADAQVTLSW
jgi:hypothetical protein